MITANGKTLRLCPGAVTASEPSVYFHARGGPSNQSQVYRKEDAMELVRKLWNEQDGQDIAEYAVMLAVILVIVVGTIRLIGSNANNVFSNVASSIQ
jgi:Flp pilus assembly pilin Flp